MAVEREEVRNQSASEDWVLREGSKEELAPEVSLAGGAEPAGQWKLAQCPQGGDQQQGNHCCSNEHSMFTETGRRSARCAASGKQSPPYSQNVVSQP